MTTTRTVPYREYAKATDEVLALRAEVERLQRENANLQRDVLDEHDANRRVLEEAERLRALLRERHEFPDYPGPAEGEVTTVDDWPAQEKWRQEWEALDARIKAATG